MRKHHKLRRPQKKQPATRLDGEAERERDVLLLSLHFGGGGRGLVREALNSALLLCWKLSCSHEVYIQPVSFESSPAHHLLWVLSGLEAHPELEARPIPAASRMDCRSSVL